MKQMMKLIAGCLSAICLLSPVHAAAVELETPAPMTETAGIEAELSAEELEALQAEPLADDLIENKTATCSSGKNTLYLTGKVECDDVMKTIGFKSIQIERSSNGSSFTTVSTPPDLTSSNVKKHSEYNHAFTVTGGYYYRITLCFYAKEKGIWFPKSQSTTYTTNSVWVPA